MRGKTQVPADWQVVRLGDVASLRTKQVNPLDSDSSPYVALENIASGGSLNGHGKAADSISNKTAFRRGDTLYGKLRPNLRKVVRVDFDGICSTDILAVAPTDETAGHFLGHLLRSDMLHGHAMRGVAGTKMPRTSWAHLREFRFRCPQLGEQQAIAAVLDSIDDAIVHTEAVVAATERLRDALLHELLTRGVPGWHSEWKDVPGIGTVPACWEVVRLGDVCTPPEYGASASARPFDPELPRYVRITDLTDDGRLRTEDARSANPSQVKGYELAPDDLLFARSGATVGKTYLYRSKDGPCVYAGYLIRFRPVPSLAAPKYLGLWTHSETYQRWVASMFRAGAQPNINAREYSSMRVPLPPLDEQGTVAAALDGIDDTLDRSRTERDRLHSLKSSASNALLTGRARVSV